MFTEEFIKQLPDDPLKAAAQICDAFFSLVRSLRDRKTPFRDYYNLCLEAFAFAEVFIEANGLDVATPHITADSPMQDNLDNIDALFQRWKDQTKEELTERDARNTLENARAQYRNILGKGVIYEFSDEDFAEVQELLNRLREILTKSKDFEEEHRLRLLKKLEILQLELHKKMSNFDRFWGFFVDSSIALRKFWENVEPFREDVKEVMRIVCRTQARAENVQNFLPTGLLPDIKKDDGSSKSEKDT